LFRISLRSSCIRERRLLLDALTFDDRIDEIRRQILDDLFLPTRPTHLDSVNDISFSEAEV